MKQGKDKLMAQPIDNRILVAAQRAVARARGQEISIEPLEEGVSPSVSAKLYRMTNTAEMQPVPSCTESEITASHEPIKVSDRQHQGLLSRIGGNANIVVPRGERPKPAISASERNAQVEDDEEFESVTAEIPRIQISNKDTKFGLTADGRKTAEAAGVFLDTFFAQMQRCGVRNVVVSPGMQSTALSMKAYERYGDVHVSVDERTAAYYALGLAKATGNAVILVCSGGVAAANWLPAVLEAEASRVPLILLTADKPARVQRVGSLGACDQANLFGSHVKKSIQMPIPSLNEDVLAFARQAALDACIAAHGALPNIPSADSGPVHLNFPFEEPLVPSKSLHPVETQDIPAAVVAGQGLMNADAMGLFNLICGKRVIALCGEGTCNSIADARLLLNFAHMRNIPLLADPLSGLRCYSDAMIIDHYDTIFGGDKAPHAEVVIRFGRWPMSERAMEAVSCMNSMQIVVDMRDARDDTNSTDLFVRCAPTVFCEALTLIDSHKRASRRACKEWQHLNDEASRMIREVRLREDNSNLEGAYVYEVMESAPDNSMVWVANGSSIQSLDTFYCKGNKRLSVFCNRGMSAIDGAISSALGAAQAFDQSTIVTGDISLLRDCSALSLQNEFRLRSEAGSAKMPSIIIVLLNSNGAAAFDALPQKVGEDCFDRLFTTPQAVDFKRIADGFGVTFRTVSSVYTFRRTYSSLIGEPGINIIEIPVPKSGFTSRHESYWKI